MQFLKYSILVIIGSVIVGMTPSLLKFIYGVDIIATEAKERKDSFLETRAQKTPFLVAGGAKIPLYLADTEEKRIKGLGDMASLRREYGMFFIFDYSGHQSIWMKDMLFPIDIIWIDGNYKIVHIERNISPDTYPRIFTAPIPASFVLELNAGMSEFYNLKIGQEVIYVSN